MRTARPIFIFLSICLLLQACQSFVADNKSNAAQPDNLLLGVWENILNYNDGPPNISAVKFEEGGKLTYYSELGYGSKKIRKGNYQTSSDTIIVVFNSKTIKEKYLFKLTDAQLILEPMFNQYSFNTISGKIFDKKEKLDSYYFD